MTSFEGGAICPVPPLNFPNKGRRISGDNSEERTKPIIEKIYVGQFAAMQKHQTRERIFHGPVLFLHPCWELNLGPLRDLSQLYPSNKFYWI